MRSLPKEFDDRGIVELSPAEGPCERTHTADTVEWPVVFPSGVEALNDLLVRVRLAGPREKGNAVTLTIPKLSLVVS